MNEDIDAKLLECRTTEAEFLAAEGDEKAATDAAKLATAQATTERKAPSAATSSTTTTAGADATAEAGRFANVFDAPVNSAAPVENLGVLGGSKRKRVNTVDATAAAAADKPTENKTE